MCKNIRIRFKRSSAFAYACAIAVAHGDNRGSRFAGQLKNPDDLCRLFGSYGAIHHGKILSKDIDRPAVDRAGARHHAGVVREHTLLDKTASVQQHGHAFTRSLLAALLLFLNASGIPVKNVLLAREHLAEILKGAHSTIASVII